MSASDTQHMDDSVDDADKEDAMTPRKTMTYDEFCKERGAAWDDNGTIGVDEIDRRFYGAFVTRRTVDWVRAVVGDEGIIEAYMRDPMTFSTLQGGVRDTLMHGDADHPLKRGIPPMDMARVREACKGAANPGETLGAVVWGTLCAAMRESING